VKQTALFSSKRTLQVSESAQHVVQISQNGKKSTEETLEEMKRIRAQMQLIADRMVRLSEQSQTVGEIIATVEDLAQQSNLLSVNAAIEAAKAGEHGRGFGVVAQEVKSLSEQSRAATTQVRTILSEIQKAANAAVIATEQGTKAVEAGVRQSGEAGESIVLLLANVADAAAAASQIAASSQQQTLGMDQVATAMERIKTASNQNVESAKELEGAARDLSNLGERLKELVGRHKLRGQGTPR
ncbi:MAG TPA: methyl-accepting chemotaxis protein, partial [Humisphaera sp.]|nr:methyl-accepting chemotaxis protein [Humisphaera sp.]